MKSWSVELSEVAPPPPFLKKSSSPPLPSKSKSAIGMSDLFLRTTPDPDGEEEEEEEEGEEEEEVVSLESLKKRILSSVIRSPLTGAIFAVLVDDSDDDTGILLGGGMV